MLREIIKAKKIEGEKNLDIRVSRKDRNKLEVSYGESQMKKSKSLIKSHLNMSNYLSTARVDDDFDTKSVRSSANFTDSTKISKVKPKKRKSSFQMESEESYTALHRGFVLKVMKRRNLCRFLLNLANTLFGLQLIDRIPRVMLVFMLVKKSVLLICSLARFISTGKGES